MVNRMRQALLSAPLRVKIAGIGVITVVVLGTAMAWFVTNHIERMAGAMTLREHISFLSPFLVVIAIAAAAALVVSSVLARAIVRPIEQLTRATERLAAGDFSSPPRIDQGDEIGTLARSVTSLAGSLAENEAQLVRRDDERKRLLSRLVDAQEREKRGLARELHDHFGQMLSLLLLLTRSLRRTRGEERRGEILGEIDNHIAGIIEDVRRLSSDLRPAVLDDYGLDSAMGRQVEFLRASGAFEVEYSFDSPGEGRLPGQLETAIYRIAQEAITNIIRHAQAQRISIGIEAKRREVRMEISDDGRGFDSSPGAPGRAGIGLSTMEERTSLLDGSFAIESRPGGGTRLRVSFPLERGSA